MLSKDAARKRSQRQYYLPNSCQECGSTNRVQRHHPDYQDPDRVEFLCQACHVKADQRDGHRRQKQPQPCPVCTVEFVPARNRQKTCGADSCRSELGRRNAAKRWQGHDRTKTCIVCRKAFTARRSRDKLCGRPECAHAHKSRVSRERHARRREA